MSRKTVVVIGAGFAGLTAARALKKTNVDVVLIDRRNHHLFQPLLYQVATAALSPAQIAQPIRSVVKKQKNCRVVLGEVTGINTEKKLVMGEVTSIHYDYLIVATGATHTYFGNDQWQKFAPGLKSIEDATLIRKRILSAFERAETSEDADEQKALLTFVIVGGGPTGVEMAGAIAELSRNTLKDEFRRINPAKSRVLLVEGSDSILRAFPKNLSDKAVIDLKRMGVEVVINKAITECSEEGVKLGEEFIATKNIIWAAGVQASPAGKWLKAESDRAGRVFVKEDLSLPNHPEIFVIGDTAAVKDVDGFVPGLAPAAVQQGKYVASIISAKQDGEELPEAFAYKNAGIMATIGRGKAIADLKRTYWSGYIAWWIWGLIHVMPLVGFRNRLVVACDWVWSYFTHERGVRIITVSKKIESEL